MSIMPFVPQVHAQRRAQRVRFEDATPVVLRYPDGRRFSGELQVISVTGGLLCKQGMEIKASKYKDNENKKKT